MGTLDILSWNVNGLRAAISHGFLKWAKKRSPDIICLQEIKAGEEKAKELLEKLEGYKIFVNSADKKGYSGVLTLSKSEPEKVRLGFGSKKFDSEGRVLTTWFDNFVLVNVYAPHSQRELKRLDYKLEFNKAFFAYIKKLRGNVVLGGDFNVAHREVDLANPKQNEKNAGFTKPEREFAEKLVGSGWADTFRHFNKEPGHYTWWTYRFNARERNIGWRIDYFFVRQRYIRFVKSAFILKDVMGSDHCPVGIKLEI